MAKKRILIVDDEKLISWSLLTMLQNAGYEAVTASNGADALQQLQAFKPELVMLDVCLPDANGINLIKEFKAHDDDICVVVMTAFAHADSAVSALKNGADDYFGKPFNLDAIRHLVDKVFEKKRLKTEVEFFRRELRKKSDHDKLIGCSKPMIDIFKMIKVCADTDAKTVLILGESGTGKELVARAIHSHSARKDMPFIEVNCAAIPESLLDNELFGHERGAYTDASKRQRGIFELAEGGTVFLDEIGDMPYPMQAKVLKAIETKRFRRLGGEEDVEADIRIIAATNQDLPKMVSESRFRGDLFFRLNVMSINLPPLRERNEDIPGLVHYFIDKLNDEYGRDVEKAAPETLEYLARYHWPGNVRELRNTIERAMMLEQGFVLTPSYLNDEIRKARKSEGYGGRCAEGSGGFTLENLSIPPEGISIEEVEKELIILALERTSGNQTKAARLLKMSRDTLRYRMKKFGLADGKPEDGDREDEADDGVVFGALGWAKG